MPASRKVDPNQDQSRGWSLMARYRKKPVEVEARQINTLDYDGLCDILKWSGSTPIDNDDVEAGTESGPVMIVHTLEGPLDAGDGYWIVEGVKGEFHPVRPDIFAATYEPVSD